MHHTLYLPCISLCFCLFNRFTHTYLVLCVGEDVSVADERDGGERRAPLDVLPVRTLAVPLQTQKGEGKGMEGNGREFNGINKRKTKKRGHRALMTLKT